MGGQMELVHMDGETQEVISVVDRVEITLHCHSGLGL